MLIRYLRDSKGIRGCIAIGDTGDIAYSLCHSNGLDRRKSTKKLAREIATNRLQAGKVIGYVNEMTGHFQKDIEEEIIPAKIVRLIKRTLKHRNTTRRNNVKSGVVDP